VPEEPVTFDELERLLLRLMGSSAEALECYHCSFGLEGRLTIRRPGGAGGQPGMRPALGPSQLEVGQARLQAVDLHRDGLRGLPVGAG
jgi:hypothetical protein